MEMWLELNLGSDRRSIHHHSRSVCNPLAELSCVSPKPSPLFMQVLKRLPT